MNIGALRSAFKNALLNFSRVPARRPVVLLRVSVMGGSKRSFSKLAKPTSLIAAEKMDNKFKGLSGERQTNSLDVAAAKLLEIQHIQDDPAKIEGMTVQELRTILRNIGVPAKGRKSELVSALKCFMDRHLYGESSQGVEEHLSSKSAGKVPQQREFGNVSDESSLPTTISLSEVTEIKQTKKRVKENSSGNKIVKVDCEIMSEEKLSLETCEVSVNKSSRAKRKISSNTVIKDIKADIVTGPQDESWTVLAHKKPQKDWIPYNPRTMRPAPPSGDTKFLKLMSWNVNGLRALLKLEGFSALELARRENFDVLCLQETKLQEKDIASIKQGLIDGYDNSFWTCSNAKLGYSGTAVVSRIKPLSVRYGLGTPDHDNEGRLVTVEFESFYLINVYVPNSGDGLKRLPYRITQWDLYLSNYMKELEKSKPVILTGDLNCAHQEIDIFNPAGNRRSAGFTDEERESFGTNFLSRGFVDTFRRQHPNVVGYTYWGYRHGGRKTNKGWRLDYFLASESIADMVHDSYIVPDVYGSDHCPIGLILKL